MPEPMVLVRPARRADLPAIMAMLDDDAISRSREIGRTASEDATARAFEEIERDPNSTIYVLDREGEVVGCAQLTTIPGLARQGTKRALVEAVRIRSDLRGRGLGRDFMDSLATKARAAGCGLMQLTSDKRRLDAHRFYVSLGYVQSHEGFKLPLD